MTDIEISKALALAIGWREDQVGIGQMSTDGMSWIPACVTVRPDGCKYGRPFWYTDWNVIGPIAERYDAFPIRAQEPHTGWCARVRNPENWSSANRAETPQKAIALAVIKGAEK